MRTPDGVALAAVSTGTGRRGVVLVHELGPGGLCGWWDYAAYLSQRGFHVLLFDHRCTGESDCPSVGPGGNGLMIDINAAVDRLRSEGAARVALVGGSQGASEALIAASRASSGVTGVVALSADELTQPLAASPYPATANDAAPRLCVPVLFAVARGDTYVSVSETRRLVAATRSTDKHLTVLAADSGHGWDLVLADSAGTRPALSDTVVAFLRAATSVNGH
jgi:pimeloyl-ACP methyl ester carboxylesterase